MTEPIAETTSLLNEQFRTHATRSPRFKNGAEAFNQLSPIPDEPIDLGDGRELRIVEWAPVGDEEVWCNKLNITVRGFICLKEKSE